APTHCGLAGLAPAHANHDVCRLAIHRRVAPTSQACPPSLPPELHSDATACWRPWVRVEWVRSGEATTRTWTATSRSRFSHPARSTTPPPANDSVEKRTCYRG